MRTTLHGTNEAKPEFKCIVEDCVMVGRQHMDLVPRQVIRLCLSHYRESRPVIIAVARINRATARRDRVS